MEMHIYVAADSIWCSWCSFAVAEESFAYVDSRLMIYWNTCDILMSVMLNVTYTLWTIIDVAVYIWLTVADLNW